MRLSITASVLLLGCGVGGAPGSLSEGVTAPDPTRLPALEEQRSGTDVLLQAISAVDTAVVWVSGHRGTYARTTDGGRTWSAGRVAGADTLQFRDVHAASAGRAWLLAAGPGDMSRIYHTDDGGASWSLQWTNPEPEGFYDCLDFWDDRRGIVYGDAVDRRLRILRTDDGGRSWRRVSAADLPPALPNEGGFAASGTCAVTGPDGRAWIAAGNAAQARVFRTSDYGRTWSAASVPVETGDGAGLTSISMVDERTGTAFGGNLAVTDVATRNVARTRDGGRTWAPLPPLSFAGAAYGGLHLRGSGRDVLLAVGPRGLAVSLDGGASWSTVDGRSWWGIGAVRSAGLTGIWVAGPEGRIGRVRFPAHP